MANYGRIASAVSTAALDAANAAMTAAQNARQMVLNRDPALATVQETVQTLQQTQATLATLAANYETALQSSVADRQDLHDQVAILTQQVAALQANPMYDPAPLTARVTALEQRMPAVASGRGVASTVNILGGGTYAINVTFDSPAPNTNYQPLAVLDSSSAQLFGSLALVSITNRTTTGCTVTVKNTALLSLGGSLTATVIALRMG
jgi:uncharacterized phage infection (PIP) family protein YhgE